MRIEILVRITLTKQAVIYLSIAGAKMSFYAKVVERLLLAELRLSYNAQRTERSPLATAVVNGIFRQIHGQHDHVGQ